MHGFNKYKQTKFRNLHLCFIKSERLLTTLYIYIYVSEVARGELTDVRTSTKAIKELIEGLTENVINTDKVNMERFKQMKEFFLQLMKDSYANLEVQAYGESYSICFCYTLYT